MNARIRTQALPNSCLHHDHDHHQLVIAVRGRAEFEISGRGGHVDVMHGCLVPGGDVHSYEGIGENHHVILDIPHSSVGTNIGRLFERPLYFEADSSLRMLLAFMEQEAPLCEQFPEVADSLAVCFVSALHQRLYAPASHHRICGKLDLTAIDRFIQHHLAESIPVSRLAEVAHVSPGHFHHLFKQATGMTPGHYLLSQRLERARQLLLNSHHSLAEIAVMVGFASQSSLTHAFRRQFGLSPGRLRQPH